MIKTINKAVFLDIDGVIATSRCGYDVFDPECVNNLKYLLDNCDADIVLSSTWRLYSKDEKKVRRLLFDIGHLNRLVAYTPDLAKNSTVDQCRSKEIKQFLNNNKSITKFAILDDEILLSFGNNWFQTYLYDGLTTEISDKVINHLQKDE